MQSSQYTNIAFISYKREDEKWAKWLQKKLEHYKLPTEIREQNPDMEFAKNPRHVFKDTTDLSGGILAKAIKDGLDSSKFLIVICSPLAAKSEWVCKEVQDFIDSGREEYIIPFIIDGEPYSKNPDNECFPEALRALAGERELLGININENGRDSAAVKVVARMFDLKFDSLWDRFKRAASRRTILLSSLISFSIIVLFVLGLTTYNLYTEKENRKKSIAREYVSRGQLSLNHGDFYDAVRYGLKAEDDFPQTAEADAFLHDLYNYIQNWEDYDYKQVGRVQLPGSFVCSVIPTPIKEGFVIVTDDKDNNINVISFINTKTGQIEKSLKVPYHYYKHGTTSPNGKYVYLWSTTNLLIWDYQSNLWRVISNENVTFLYYNGNVGMALTKEHEFLITDALGNIQQQLSLVNFHDGEYDVAIEMEKHLVAFLFEKQVGKEKQQVLSVYDYTTGEKIYEQTYIGITKHICQIDFLPDGRLYLYGFSGLEIINNIGYNNVYSIYEVDNPGFDACYSISGLSFILNTDDDKVIIHSTGQTIQIPNGLNEIGLSLNEESMIVIDNDNMLYIYHKKPYVYNSFLDFGCFHLSFDCDSQSKQLVFSLDYRRSGSYFLISDAQRRILMGKHVDTYGTIAVTANNGTDFIYEENDKTYWWNVNTNKVSGSVKRGYNHKRAVSLDGEYMVSYLQDTLYIFNNKGKQLIESIGFPIKSAYDHISSLDFNKSGDMAILIGSEIYIYKSCDFDKIWKHFKIEHASHETDLFLKDDCLYYANDDGEVWKVRLDDLTEDEIISGDSYYSVTGFSKAYNGQVVYYRHEYGERGSELFIFDEYDSIKEYTWPYLIQNAEFINRDEILVTGYFPSAIILPVSAFVHKNDINTKEYIKYTLSNILK